MLHTYLCNYSWTCTLSPLYLQNTFCQFLRWSPQCIRYIEAILKVEYIRKATFWVMWTTRSIRTWKHFGVIKYQRWTKCSFFPASTRKRRIPLLRFQESHQRRRTAPRLLWGQPWLRQSSNNLVHSVDRSPSIQHNKLISKVACQKKFSKGVRMSRESSLTPGDHSDSQVR